jgi:hypothetical protein
LPALLLSLLALLLVHLALATHLLGGEMTYRYLDANGPAAAPFRYKITVKVYHNCNLGVSGVAAPNTNAIIGFITKRRAQNWRLPVSTMPGRHGLMGGSVQSGVMNITSYSLSPNCISPRIPLGCGISGPSQPFQLQKFVDIVNLPASLNGYYAVLTRSARNNDVANITNLATRH